MWFPWLLCIVAVDSLQETVRCEELSSFVSDSVSREYLEDVPSDPYNRRRQEAQEAVETDEDIVQEEDDEVNRVPLEHDPLTPMDDTHSVPNHRFKLISLENLVNLSPALSVTLWIFIGALLKADSDSHDGGENRDDGPVVLPVSYYDVIPLRQDNQGEAGKKGRFKVASIEIQYVATPFIIALWVLIAGLTKIGFHVTPKISLICPESCLLIVVGVIIGLLLFYTGLTNVGPLTPNVFFLYMLPPIVLDAGYFMPNRLFFDNLVTILMFAVLGTVLNAMSVGLSLWAVGLTGLYGVQMPLLDTLLFSSIACAVDPVAVLAVFEEIHVNEVLYILVFGESLLNDAVTVVLYHMFEGYTEMGPSNIIPVDYLAGVASFFVVAIGGTLVGIIWGLLAAFISRFTHHVRVIEPLFVFVMSYLSYVSAELFHFSGILALTFCGITMKNYVEENISYKSHVTVKYGMKMLASSSETIIFLFLGVSTVNDNHDWNTWFVVMTILFCTVYRTIGVIILTTLANRFRLHRINRVEQFIMAYGGLRGAVAFALVLIVSDRIIPTKNMMVTTIIALVYFTVFLQGMTIGPLVRILNVPTSNKIKPSMNERIHTRLMDHLMAGIEDIAGQMLGNYHLRDKFKYYNNKYLRPVLTRGHSSAEPKIFETYSKLNLADAINLVKQNGNLVPVVGNDSGMSLAMLFRSYTQVNLSKSLSPCAENRLHFPKSSLPRNDSSFLNVDIGELEYSPSHKDLADAELHHILADAMFKPPRRHRPLNKDQLFEQKDHQPFRHQMRMQIRHLVSEHCHHRRRSNHSHGQSRRSNSINHNNNFVQRAASPTPSESNNSNGLLTGHKKQPPPTLKFSLPDETPTDWGVPTPMPTQTGAALQEPLSAYSSLVELSSSMSHDDEGIIFVADEHPSPSPDPQESEVIDEVIMVPSSPIHEPKTLTETTLPWKRQDDFPDGRKCVRKQQEFPSWIENKDYLFYGSPTNTFLKRLGSTSKINTPSVYDVFNADRSDISGPKRDNAKPKEDGEDCVFVDQVEESQPTTENTDNFHSAKEGDLTCVQIENADSQDSKEVVIIMSANAEKCGEDKDDDDDSLRWQATRL